MRAAALRLAALSAASARRMRSSAPRTRLSPGSRQARPRLKRSGHGAADERALVQAVEDLLARAAASLGRVRVHQQRREDDAAVAGDQVGAAMARAQPLRDLAHHLVGVLAADAVVDGAEVVGVDHEQRQRAARPQRAARTARSRSAWNSRGPSSPVTGSSRISETRRLWRPSTPANPSSHESGDSSGTHDGRRGRQRERGRRAIRAQAEPELGSLRVLAGGGARAAPVGHAIGRAGEDADEATVRGPARQLDAVRAPVAQPRRVRRRRRGEALRVREVRELRQRTGTVETVVAQGRAARSPGDVHGDGACAEQRRQPPDVQADQVCGSHALSG